MRRAGARYAVGLAGAAMVALAGCSSGAPPAAPGGTGPAATAPATSAATTTASGSATTADPGVPAAAKAQTPEGAVAFTSYFFTLLNQAWTKPQAGLLSPHFTPACLTCQNYEKDANAYVIANAHYNKTPVEVMEVSTHGPPKSDPHQEIDVVFNQPAASVIDAAGKSIEEIRPGKGIFVTELDWMESRWQVTSIKLLK